MLTIFITELQVCAHHLYYCTSSMCSPSLLLNYKYVHIIFITVLQVCAHHLYYCATSMCTSSLLTVLHLPLNFIIVRILRYCFVHVYIVACTIAIRLSEDVCWNYAIVVCPTMPIVSVVFIKPCINKQRAFYA